MDTLSKKDELVSDENGDNKNEANQKNIVNNQYQNIHLDLAEEEEDWTSDDYWEPTQPIFSHPNHKALWRSFVLKRMSEGHFCPADIHVPIIYNKKEPVIEEPGQFDDVSSDEENNYNVQPNKNIKTNKQWLQNKAP